MEQRNYKIPTLDAATVYKYMDAGYALSLYQTKRDENGKILRGPDGKVQKELNKSLFNAELHYCLETEMLEKELKEKFGRSISNTDSIYDILSVSFESTYKEYNPFGKVEGYYFKDDKWNYILYVKAGWIYLPDNEKETEGYICRNKESEIRHPLKNGLCVQDKTLLAIRIPQYLNENDPEKKEKDKKKKEKKLDAEVTQKLKELLSSPKAAAYIFKKTEDGAYVFDEKKNIPDCKKRKELRKSIYDNGIDLLLQNENSVFRYIRYKKSAGMSREGKIFFIREELYEPMKKWTDMDDDWDNEDSLRESGLVRKENTVKYEAYSALTLSTIEQCIDIDPKSILYVRDAESRFEDEVVSVFQEGGSLKAERKKVKVHNKIWDGEALLDESVFREAGRQEKGMMLLRNRFFKSCAFNTKLQRWFEENNITEVSQLNGILLDPENTKIEDIKMVVTDSSLKILNILKSKEDKENPARVFRYWADRISNRFGIVKSDKPTGFLSGKLVRTSYQMINTIGFNGTEEAQVLCEPYDRFFDSMQKDWHYFKWYLEQSQTIEDDDSCYNLMGYEEDWTEERTGGEAPFTSYSENAKTVLSLLERCPNEFSGTRMYRSFRNKTKFNITKSLHNGRVLIPGTNATIFGNGYELLKAAIISDYDPSKDNDDRILNKNQIYIKAFQNGEKLVCIRYPHITMGNVLYAENKYHEVWDKWFNLSNEIICVNAIGFNIQQMLNGCDYDSDTMLVTNSGLICDAVKHINNERFPVPYNSIEEGRVISKDLSIIDNDIANNKVGEIINESQRLNSIYWSIYNREKIGTSKIFTEYMKTLINENGVDSPEKLMEVLYDDICKLAVLSNIEIDKAKHQYEVSAGAIIKNIKEKYVQPMKYSDGEQKEMFSAKADWFEKILKERKKKNGEVESQKKDSKGKLITVLTNDCPMGYLNSVKIQDLKRDKNSTFITSLFKVEQDESERESENVRNWKKRAEDLACLLQDNGIAKGYRKDQITEKVGHGVSALKQDVFKKCTEQNAVDLLYYISGKEKEFNGNKKGNNNDIAASAWLLLSALCYSDGSGREPAINKVIINQPTDKSFEHVEENIGKFFGVK